MGEWRPIETHPKQEPVLLWVPDGPCGHPVVEVGEFWGDDEYACWWSNGGPNAGDDLDWQPTHWMPRPGPPA